MRLQGSKRIITPRKAFLFLYDLSMSVFLAFLAFLVSFNFETKVGGYGVLKRFWPAFLLTALLCNVLFGLYRQMWLVASIGQYFRVLLAVGSQCSLLFIFFIVFVRTKINWAGGILYALFMVIALLSIRMLYRLYTEHRRRLREKTGLGKEKKRTRVLIVGAGMAGTRMAEDLLYRDPERRPVAFVDDNPKTHQYSHMGVSVLGGREEIPAICERLAVDEILIALPSAGADNMKDIVAICQKTSCRIRILPAFLASAGYGYEELMGHIKDIDLNDLLGREPIAIAKDSVAHMVQGKRVFLTGAGGSIGSEIARQLASYGPAELCLLDIYENHVYDLQQELLGKYGKDFPLKVYIGSVREPERLTELFEVSKPEIVYHAAAHKHVPLMEHSPFEAVKNNSFGTLHVLQAAAHCGCERFILISTDKAVHPTSVMGASKRLAELLTLAMARRYPSLKYAMVRFGNVLDSSGSIIPLWKRQIREEKRITLTHPEIERFFMTIPEACSLVLQASVYAEGGDIFVLDMGKQVKMMELGKALIRLSGYEPNVDIPIEIIGLRPGEKLYEELFREGESYTHTDHEKIMRFEQTKTAEEIAKELSSLYAMIGRSYPSLSALILNGEAP